MQNGHDKRIKSHTAGPALRRAAAAIVLGLLVAGALAPPRALAVTVTDTLFTLDVSSILRSLVLDPGETAVYTLDLEDGTLEFGDGQAGAVPPTGDGAIVATYRTGGGEVGNVFELPAGISVNNPYLIPLAAFFDAQTGEPDLSFVLFGVETLAFTWTDDGLLITEVRVVPEPAALGLLGIGLLGLAMMKRRRKAA